MVLVPNVVSDRHGGIISARPNRAASSVKVASVGLSRGCDLLNCMRHRRVKGEVSQGLLGGHFVGFGNGLRLFGRHLGGFGGSFRLFGGHFVGFGNGLRLFGGHFVGFGSGLRLFGRHLGGFGGSFRLFGGHFVGFGSGLRLFGRHLGGLCHIQLLLQLSHPAIIRA